MNKLARVGMGHRHQALLTEHQPSLNLYLWDAPGAIQGVTQKGMPQGCHVDTDLVGSTRQYGDLHAAHADSSCCFRVQAWCQHHLHACSL